jgi:putative transposase
MARIWRWVVPEYPHHVTQRGVRSMDVFQTDEDRQSYLHFSAAEAGRFEVEILVWCLTDSGDIILIFRKLSRTGRPAGDAAFVRSVERLTARDLSKGKPGRLAKRGK